MKKLDTVLALLSGCGLVSAQITLPVRTPSGTLSALPDVVEVEQNLKTIPVLASTSATASTSTLNVDSLPSTLATKVNAVEGAADATSCRGLQCLPVATLNFSDLDALDISWRPPVPTGIPENREAPAVVPAKATAEAVVNAGPAAFSFAFEPRRSDFILPPHKEWETARPTPSSQPDPYSQWVLTAKPTTYRHKAIDVPPSTTCAHHGEYWSKGSTFCSQGPKRGGGYRVAAVAEPTGVVDEPRQVNPEVHSKDEPLIPRPAMQCQFWCRLKHWAGAAKANPRADILPSKPQSDDQVLNARQDGIYKPPPPGPQCVFWCRLKHWAGAAKATPQTDILQTDILSPEDSSNNTVLSARQDGIYRPPPPPNFCTLFHRVTRILGGSDSVVERQDGIYRPPKPCPSFNGVKRMLGGIASIATAQGDSVVKRQDGIYRPPHQKPNCIWFCRIKGMLGGSANIEAAQGDSVVKRQDGVYRPPHQKPNCIWFCRIKHMLESGAGMAVPSTAEAEAEAEAEAAAWGAIKRMLGGGARPGSHSLQARQAIHHLPPDLEGIPPRLTPPEADTA